MQLRMLAIATAAALALTAGSRPAAAAGDQVVIGDLDDMSGVYADVLGAGGVEAINMAIADFGGTVLGKKIVTLSADHQNKPDIGASKFREWADQNGFDVLFGGSNTGVDIAMAKIAAAKKVPFFVIGAGGASLTNEDCTAYSVHYVYDTTALANGTATAMVNADGKTWFYLTRGLRLRLLCWSPPPAWSSRTGAEPRCGARPLGAADFSSFLLQAQASGARSSGSRTPAPTSAIR